MAADATDLKHIAAEHIGPSVTIAASSAEALLVEPLVPGRYLLHTLTVAGAAALWVNQGPFGNVLPATAAAPATPIDLAEDPRAKLVFIVKGSPANKATDGLSVITDAGTVTVVVTRISRSQ